MVPAYDEPLLWEGHGSLIPEIARQLPSGVKPDAIFCSVGGGGLAGGVMRGCKSVGWDDGENFIQRRLPMINAPHSLCCGARDTWRQLLVPIASR